MNKEDIKLGDWQRLFFGNAPIEFMIEVFLRTIFIYLILLLILRFLGKRMTSQASILELAVMITLGAIIALPMQDPATGMLPGILILFCVLALQRFSNFLSFKYTRAEEIIQGEMAMLVKDGIINVKELRRSTISHEQLYSRLREKDVRHLGQVQRVYLEACGNFSIFKRKEPRAGLSIIPANDTKLLAIPVENDSYCACKNCGFIEEGESEKLDPCNNCGVKDWTPAIAEHSEESPKPDKQY